mgnify:CR=1 FL=1
MPGTVIDMLQCVAYIYFILLHTVAENPAGIMLAGEQHLVGYIKLRMTWMRERRERTSGVTPAVVLTLEHYSPRARGPGQRSPVVWGWAEEPCSCPWRVVCSPL